MTGRVESALRRQVWDQLRLLEDEILRALKASDPTDFALLRRKWSEVQRVMDDEVSPLILLRYERLAALMDDAMGRLAVQEAGAVQRLVNDVADEEIIEETPAAAPLKRRVAGALFPTPSRPTDLSTTGAEWWGRQGASLRQRIGDSLLVGVSLDESLTALTTRSRGSADVGFQDGILAKARNDASRLLTTQMTNALGEARVAVAERNAPQMMLIHSSVLDSSTSYICISRHGLRYEGEPPHASIGHSLPYLSGVPYHPS